MRNATWLVAMVAGCAHGAVTGDSPDARSPDAAPHADGAADAAPGVAPDAQPDAAACAISSGMTPQLDGVADLDDYPAAQHLAVGAMLGGDGAAIAWDAGHLYITVQSDAFAAPFEPLHVYLEAGGALAAAVPASGKEYSGLVPALPFTPTHLVAVRRVSDSGTGPYDGVILPASGWTVRQQTLAEGSDVFGSADQRTLSVAVPWTALGGCPTALRLALHVVHAVPANEWKDLVPATHTPWLTPGGGYYEIDLTGASAVAGWALR